MVMGMERGRYGPSWERWQDWASGESAFLYPFALLLFLYGGQNDDEREC